MNILFSKTAQILFIVLLIPTFSQAQKSSNSKNSLTGNNQVEDPNVRRAKEIESARKQLAEHDAKEIAAGRRLSPKIEEVLTGGPVNREVASQIANDYPNTNSRSTTSSSNNTNENDRSNSSSITEESANSNSASSQISNDYQNINSNTYDKYRGYINDQTLSGRQLSIQELDKMLAESKKAELMDTIKYVVFSIIGLFILWRLVKFINSDNTSTINNKEIVKTKVEEIPKTPEVSSLVDSSIERIEKLNNLRNSGAITDDEFEQLKKKIVKLAV